MDSSKINETCIMVLRKNGDSGELVSDYPPLTFGDQEKLNELLKRCSLDSVTTGQIYDDVVDSGLGYLFKGYNFCESVWGTYQDCYPISRNQNIYSKRGLLEQLKRRAIAYSLSEKYKECSNDPTIVAYSTRFIGWSCMNFTLNKELSISYHTNFGYGSSNYFTAILKYKDIDILPFSMWVHYYNCDAFQILRYTRVYGIENSEWKSALEFGRDVYNSLLNDPSGFANKWLVGEVESMVDGLISIFNNHSKVIAVNESNGSRRQLQTKEEIVLYKGEKMSGALSFIDKIKSIETLNIPMGYYIETILDLNRRMVPELQEVIDDYNNNLEVMQAEYEKIIEEMAPIEEFVDIHVSDCAINFIGGTDYSSEREARKVMEELSSDFEATAGYLDELEDKKYNLDRAIGHISYIIYKLKGYVETINDATKKEYESVA